MIASGPGPPNWSCRRRLRSARTVRLPRAVQPSARIIVAYEPYWAIGAAQPAPTDYVADVCRRIRVALTDDLDQHSGDLAVTYGGRAGPGLRTALGDAVDGLFLGRCAHQPDAVADILTGAATHRRLAS